MKKYIVEVEDPKKGERASSGGIRGNGGRLVSQYTNPVPYREPAPQPAPMPTPTPMPTYQAQPQPQAYAPQPQPAPQPQVQQPQTQQQAQNAPLGVDDLPFS